MIGLSEAAKQTGKRRQTIHKAIKEGRISASKGVNGEWEIDPAELFRVYSPVSQVDINERPQVDAGLHSMDSVLQREVDVLRERLTEKDTLIEDLRRDRDEWRRQATLLLTDQRPKARKQVWPWVVALALVIAVGLGIAGWAVYSGWLVL